MRRKSSESSSLLSLLAISGTRMLVALILVVACVGFYGLFRWLVHSNARWALLWHVVITERVLDVLTRKTRPQRILQAVQRNATKGNPDSVISAVDHFCKNSEWAMNVGDEKGAILDSVVLETSPSTALELGTYCGYSTVRIARLLPPETRLITMEMNPECAAVARQVIQHAGLQDKVLLVEGASGDLIPKMAAMFGIQTFDFVFLDHWKDRYLPDLKLLETCGLLSAGSVLLADNVICPGTPDYLQYVRNSSKYSSCFYTAHLEYTAVHDGLEKSIYQE